MQNRQVTTSDSQQDLEKKLVTSLILTNKDDMMMKVLQQLYGAGKGGLSIERLMKETIGEKGTWEQKHILYTTLVKLSTEKLIKKDTTKSLIFTLTGEGVGVIRTQKLVERTVLTPITNILSTEIKNIDKRESSVKERYLTTLNRMLSK